VIRLGLLGASGRLGSLIQDLVKTDFAHEFTLVACPSRSDSLAPLLSTDVVMDVSLPEAFTQWSKSAEYINALGHKSQLPVFVIGSTGWTPEQRRVLEQLAQSTLVLQSSNFSIGVGLLARLISGLGPLANTLGFEVSMKETHHIHKKDAPSGTALTLQSALGSKIPIESVREGEVIGEHEIVLEAPEETLRFQHRALDRRLFARGALQVAGWLHGERSSRDPSITPGRILTLQDYFKP
jgi:4-hydroxy-tetrahydrodipicolinate reductase